MRRKPTASRPVIALAARLVWRGLYLAEWDDLSNYPRKQSTLFRCVGGTWFSGEENPTGCKSSPLRPAPVAVAAMLSAVSLIP